MFITCQECNTTFRLDESLLKPTGSKVRCSQCRNMFLAYPPAPQPAQPVFQEAFTSAMPLDASPPPAPQMPEEEQELEGIDLAELDSILERETPHDAGLEEELRQELAGADAADELPELDDADLDLDFDAALDLDSDESAADETVVAEEGVEEELDLDMDFTLDDDLPPVSNGEAEAVADLEDALSLEADLEEAGKAVLEDAPVSDDDLDLDIDLGGLDSGADEEVIPMGTADASGDDLDLANLDFDLDGETPEKEISGEEPELSLADESDFTLDEAGPELETPVPADAEEGASQDLDLDLDLGDELELDMDDTPDAAAQDAAEPELELETDASAESTGDDLDLSDLDSLLETGDGDLGVETDESEDIELELDLDDNAAEAPAQAEGGDELEDLDFELDSEFTDGPADEAESAETTPTGGRAGDTIGEDGEIDLSDIEEMLEGDQVAETAVKPIEAFEADLDLGLGDDSGEIDLSEIESAIDSADSVDSARELDEAAEEPDLELDLDLDDQPQPTAEQTSEPLELDLSLDDDEVPTNDDMELDLDLELELESDTRPIQAEVAEEADDELDLSDLSELVEEPKKKTETIDNGDIELEFEIEEDTAEPVAAVEDVNRTAGRVPEIPIEETMEAPFVEGKPEKPPKPVKPKKKTSKTLLVLFLLILLGGIGYGAYYAVTELGIEIPYLSDYLKPKPQDPAGTLNLSTMEINSKFIENSLSGRLFVITGKVRNGYSANREKVRLQGKLFTKGKVLVKTEYSYAGIMLDDQELATLPIAQIKQRLNAVPQVQTGNTVVKPGQNLPFMVVFSELPPPEQLDEFAIELLSSVQGR